MDNPRDSNQREGTFRVTSQGTTSDSPWIQQIRSQAEVPYACDGPVDWAMVVTGADRIWGLLRGAQMNGNSDPTSFSEACAFAPFF